MLKNYVMLQGKVLLDSCLQMWGGEKCFVLYNGWGLEDSCVKLLCIVRFIPLLNIYVCLHT